LGKPERTEDVRPLAPSPLVLGHDLIQGARGPALVGRRDDLVALVAQRDRLWVRTRGFEELERSALRAVVAAERLQGMTHDGRIELALVGGEALPRVLADPGRAPRPAHDSITVAQRL